MNNNHYIFQLDRESTTALLGNVESGDTIFLCAANCNYDLAFALCDLLRPLKLAIVACGSCSGPGLVVLMAGAHRFSTKHTLFRITPPDAEIKETMAQLINERTGMLPELAESLLSSPSTFTSEQGLEMGLVDEVWEMESLAEDDDEPEIIFVPDFGKKWVN